jgi:GTP cyclohydrolase I
MLDEARTAVAAGLAWGAPPPDAHPRLRTFEAAAAALIAASGDDPGREGLRDTSARAAAAWGFLTAGYASDAADVVGGAVYAADGAQLVTVRDIRFYSLCEHHLLPFFGVAHVEYVPAGSIIGLSKLARVVDVYARRLQVQERLTVQVAEAIDRLLRPHGVRVVVEAEHLCMAMRGVERPGAVTTTVHELGTLHGSRSEPEPLRS